MYTTKTQIIVLVNYINGTIMYLLGTAGNDCAGITAIIYHRQVYSRSTFEEHSSLKTGII